jgi:cobalt ECF transporter T component CbiQ
MGLHTFIDRIAALYGEERYESITVADRKGIYRWDARIKLLMLAAAVGLNVVVAQLWLSVLIFAASGVLAIWSRIPWRPFALFFLAPAWATLAVFVGFSAGFGTTPLVHLGPLTFYHEGMRQGLSAAARVACDMSWMAAVFLTTPLTQVLAALRWFRVPGILVEMLAMAYRYAFLLLEQFSAMRAAALARGGFRSFSQSLKNTAMILARVILRAYDRATAVQAAMTARGESGLSETDRDHFRQAPYCPNQCDITPDFPDETLPILTCRDVAFARGPVRSLQGVSLTVDRGEMVVLCGPNGAGKTTLLSLIAGLLMADEGEIRLCGRLLDRHTRKDAFRRVGLLSQDPNDQLFCTHVWEDIAFGALNRGLETAAVKHLVETAMALMEVSHLAARPIHQLSYGEMRRVGLAGLIAMQPPLILLDEPAAGLDPAATRHLVSLIQHLNTHHGYTFIIVTHDINLAAQLARRIVILDQGRIIADAPAREILVNNILLESARLEPPILTTLFQQFLGDSVAKDHIPITVVEALELLRAIKKEQCPK